MQSLVPNSKMIYRIEISETQRAQVMRHLASDVSREHGGFLMGRITASGTTRVTSIEDIVACPDAPGSMEFLTFTPDCWQLAHTHPRLGEDEFRIVGWYHSPPGMHTRMSRQDEWLHSNFFSDCSFVAWIHDPIEGTHSYWRWDESSPKEFDSTKVVS